MRESGQPPRPVVTVLCVPGAAQLREVMAGIEEEGVPCTVEEGGSGSDATALAARAAERSPLQVGVGIAADGSVCVTHRALPPDRPVECSAAGCLPEEARRLGHNAARVVVGLPLRTGG